MMTLAILFLFFLQLVTELIASTYAFGLLQVSIPPEIVSVLFLLTPVLLLIFPKRLPRGIVLALGWLVLLCRAVSILLEIRGRMVLSGLGVGAGLLFFPLLIWYIGQEKNKSNAGYQAGLNAGLAVMVSILLRSFGSGNELSSGGLYRVITWVLALAAAILIPRLLRPEQERGETRELPTQRPGFGRLTTISLGIISAFTLLYFGFASPTVISRWTQIDYRLVTGLAALPAAVWIFLWTRSARFREALTRPVVLVWNLVWTISLALTLFLNQVPFPASSSDFPVFQPPSSPLVDLSLGLMLISYPIIFIDLALLIQEVIDRRPSIRRLGGAFSIAALYLLLVILAQVFTTIYDYIPVVGPLFRDRFWLVFSVAALVLVFPAVFSSHRVPSESTTYQPQPWFAWLVLAVALAAISGVLLMGSQPSPGPEKNSLRVLTYNIQQGYNASGEKDYSGQLALIRSTQPDIIGLQETDNARAAGGNSDVVRFLADQLDMYSYYGPNTVTGTFGIALLARYPIQNPHTFFMYSEGEQTAAIEAEIQVGSRTFHILVTHLGNSGPIIQQEQVLQVVDGKEDLIAMGDFNFRPDTDQYALTTQHLDEAWLAANHQTVIPEGFDISRRIDYIYISPEIRVSEAQYLGRGPSDHPAFFAEIVW